MSSAWTPIASADSPSGGAFTFSSLTLTGIEVLQIVASGITVTSDDSTIAITWYIGGAEVTTNYNWGNASLNSGSTTVLNDGAVTQAQLRPSSNDANWGVGNAAEESIGFVILLDGISGSLHKRCGIETAYIRPDGNVVVAQTIGLLTNTGAVQGFKIAGSSNLTAGKVRVMGLA